MKILKKQASKKVQTSHSFEVFAQNPQKRNNVHTFKIWPTEETMNKHSKTEFSVFGRSTNSAEPSTAKESPWVPVLSADTLLPACCCSECFTRRKKKDCFTMLLKIILMSIFPHRCNTTYHISCSHATYSQAHSLLQKRKKRSFSYSVFLSLSFLVYSIKSVCRIFGGGLIFLFKHYPLINTMRRYISIYAGIYWK